MIKRYVEKGNRRVFSSGERKLRAEDIRNIIKVDYTKVDWETLMNFRVECFTVAGVGAKELENKLKELAIQIQSGTFPGQKPEMDVHTLFEAEARKIMEQYMPMVKQAPSGWLRTNLNTAVASSYQGAQYTRLQDEIMQKVYTFYQYKTAGDNKVRDEHQRLEGRVYPAGDPIWREIWPPNGWNCRCRVEPLTSEEAYGQNIERTAGADEVKQTVKESGIPKEFQRNPGMSKSIWGKELDKEVNKSGSQYSEKESIEVMRFSNGNLTGEEIEVKDYAGYRVYIPGRLIESGRNLIKKIITEPDEVWGEIKKMRSGVREVKVRYIVATVVRKLSTAPEEKKSSGKYWVVTLAGADVISCAVVDDLSKIQIGIRIK